MRPIQLTSLITYLANFIACNVKSDEQLVLLGTIFNQLGDTLATIAILEDQCENSNTDNTCDPGLDI